jgi:hypothetical protein
MSEPVTAAAPGLGWPVPDPAAAPAPGLGWPTPNPTPATEEPA